MAKNTPREEKLLQYAQMLAAKMVGETIDSNKAITEIAFVTMAENGTIDEVTATEHIAAFEAWMPAIAYKVGNLRTDDGKLYKCLQAHTSQEGWEPHNTPALWKIAGDPTDEWPEWSQPIGASDAYQDGDKVSYDGKHWISNTNNNVWRPGDYGWNEQ